MASQHPIDDDHDDRFCSDAVQRSLASFDMIDHHGFANDDFANRCCRLEIVLD